MEFYSGKLSCGDKFEIQDVVFIHLFRAQMNYSMRVKEKGFDDIGIIPHILLEVLTINGKKITLNELLNLPGEDYLDVVNPVSQNISKLNLL